MSTTHEPRSLGATKQSMDGVSDAVEVAFTTLSPASALSAAGGFRSFY